MLTSRLAAAEQTSGGDLPAATAKASQYKKPSHKVDTRVEMARAELKDFATTYQGRLREQERVKVKLQQLRSNLAYREAKVNRLHREALG